jgi:hypothetical protein
MDEEIDVMFGPDKRTPEGGVSDKDKREFIMDVQKVGRSTVAEMSGRDLDTAYEKALSDAEKDVGGRNMGGMVRDELGYMQGGMGYTPRGPIKYSKGGAARGKKYSGSY